MKTHILTVPPESYDQILFGKRMAELAPAKNEFKTGDYVKIYELNNGKPTGGCLCRRITDINVTPEINSEYVILSIIPLTEFEKNMVA